MKLIIDILTVSFAAGAVLYLYLSLTDRRAVVSAELDLGDDDVARLPDRLRLIRLDRDAVRVPESMTFMTEQLCAEGFEDAGTHAPENIPGVVVRLLAHSAHSIYCAIWLHEAVGSWFEFSCNYPGGDTATFTTLTGSGLGGRPGHTIVRAPGLGPLELYARARRERPRGVFLPANAAHAVEDFERGYGRWMAWRREQCRTSQEKRLGAA